VSRGNGLSGGGSTTIRGRLMELIRDWLSGYLLRRDRRRRDDIMGDELIGEGSKEDTSTGLVSSACTDGGKTSRNGTFPPFHSSASNSA